MKNKHGFTLVELLLVMGIMSILMIILFQVFGSILDLKLRSEATTYVAQDSRYLITRLTYDISRASDVTLPVELSSGSSLTLVIDGQNYLYSLDDNILKLSVGGGDNLALNGIGSKINTLTFTRFANIGTKRIVQISLGIVPTTVQPGGVTLSRQLTTTVATR